MEVTSQTTIVSRYFIESLQSGLDIQVIYGISFYILRYLFKSKDMTRYLWNIPTYPKGSKLTHGTATMRSYPWIILGYPWMRPIMRDTYSRGRVQVPDAQSRRLGGFKSRLLIQMLEPTNQQWAHDHSWVIADQTCIYSSL